MRRFVVGALLCWSASLGWAAPALGVRADEPLVGEVVCHFTDPDITESSGLVVSDGLIVTVNDSGDSNRVFAVDPATGDTVGMTRWQGDATDNEALAPGPAGSGDVWVGDIGDNSAVRDHIRVARVPVGRGQRTVKAPTYDLVYPDGPHDAETLLADPATGRLYVAVKEFIGRLYAAPARLSSDAPNELTPAGSVLGLATDGAFFPDGRHVVLRNYGQASVYTWPDLDRISTVTLPAQPQGEGIAVSAAGEVFLSSEGERADVLRVVLPLGEPSPSPTVDPAGGSSARAPIQAEERSWWPWGIGAVAFAVMVGVLVRSMRPRD